MTHRKRTEPLRITILRSLASNGPQTSIQLTRRLNPYPDKSLVQARNGLNGRLRDLAQAGQAEIAGTVPADYHNTPGYLWRITPAGAKYLATWEKRRAADTERKARASVRRTERAAEREGALRALIRQAAASGWGPHTPTAERRKISRELRVQGMPYDWIAAVFDVSHEIIRQDCNGFVRRKGMTIRAEPMVVPAQGPGYVWDRTREGVA